MPPGEVKDPQSNDGNGPKTGYLYRYDKMSYNGRSIIPVLNARNLQRGQFVVFDIDYPVIDEETGTRIAIAVIPKNFEDKEWTSDLREQWDNDWNNAREMTSTDITKRDQSKK